MTRIILVTILWVTSLLLLDCSKVHGFVLLGAKSQPRRESTTKLHQEVDPVNHNDPLYVDENSINSNLAPLYQQDDDDDDDDPCDISYKYGNYQGTTKFVFIISDSTGVTGKAAVQKSLAQFDSCSNDNVISDNDCFVSLRVFTFIRSEDAIAQIIRTAQDKQAMVVFTMVEPSLRQVILQMCQLCNLVVIDLLGPTLQGMSEFLNQHPLGIPPTAGTKSQKGKFQLSDLYFRRIQAVEFTLKADDGQSPWLLKEAHVILVGVSRTGKTPLSVVLSQTMGLKVANVPLVLECDPPKELLDATKIDPQSVFCLTIAPSQLRRIRTSRLQRSNLHQVEDRIRTSRLQRSNLHQVEEEDYNVSRPRSSQSNYADRAYLTKDLQHAKRLALQQGWTEIDVTGRAVEETASYITELLHDRFEDFCL